MKRVIFSPIYKQMVIDDEALFKRMIDSGEWFDAPHKCVIKPKVVEPIVEPVIEPEIIKPKVSKRQGKKARYAPVPSKDSQ
jgi:hypothetical protein